ncbi:GUN4 domain-containing protein [Nostoc sp. C057]|uniref:GUN4 domain-containing protein n=1 Tax=Nostoc sp. C057 TaxID=2576903 RepID=UPI0021194056|nr:GUN4 domain-containing protein [Nostoc sp. C057]
MADEQTSRLMLNIAKREEQGDLEYDDIKSFSCPDLQRIDQLWVNADNRFGFSVQKKIWISTGNRLGIELGEWTDKDYENYFRFAEAVGWYDEKLNINEKHSRGFLDNKDLIKHIKENSGYGKGGLPHQQTSLLFFADRHLKSSTISDHIIFLAFSRCNL